MADAKKKKKGLGDFFLRALPGPAGEAIRRGAEYLRGRRPMPEMRPGVRKMQPGKPPKMAQAKPQPKKKKKTRKERIDEEMARREKERKERGEERPGGIGGVVSAAEERKRRMREAAGEEYEFEKE